MRLFNTMRIKTKDFEKEDRHDAVCFEGMLRVFIGLVGFLRDFLAFW